MTTKSPTPCLGCGAVVICFKLQLSEPDEQGVFDCAFLCPGCAQRWMDGEVLLMRGDGGVVSGAQVSYIKAMPPDYLPDEG